MSAFGSVWDWLTTAAHWEGPGGIPTRLLEHIWYTCLAMAISTVIALPLGLLVGHTGRGTLLVEGVANAGRALPTLGLLIIVVIVSTSDLAPIIIPLVILAIPPILVNTAAGVREVDAELKDAARGMGMTGLGVLMRAEVPSALPLILLGLRTAAIQVVATATVAAYVGAGGLGAYIVSGLSLQDYGEVGGGSVLVILLAVAVQALFTLLGRFAVSPGVRGPR